MTTFLLFGKDPRTVTPADLPRLREVPEGWFVEYKEELVSPKALAKEVGAFANRDGGWLLIGVEENEETRVASAFPGVANEELGRTSDAVRDAVSAHLSPAPIIELFVVTGDGSNGLAAGRSILVVWVPRSEATPHVHSSGSIYRRYVDKAEPKPETDPHIIQQLHERSRDYRRTISQRLDSGFDAHWAEDSSVAWIVLSFVRGPQSERVRADYDVEEFAARMRQRDVQGITFTDIHTTHYGFSARMQREQENPLGPAPTLEMTLDGNFFVAWPLSVAPATPDLQPIPFLSSSTGIAFRQLLLDSRIETATVIDGTHIVPALLGIFIHLSHLAERISSTGLYYSRMRCLNLFRRVPFFDSEQYIKRARDYGVKVFQLRGFALPSSERYQTIESLTAPELPFHVFRTLLPAFGVADQDVKTVSKEVLDVIMAQWAAARAPKQQ